MRLHSEVRLFESGKDAIAVRLSVARNVQALRQRVCGAKPGDSLGRLPRGFLLILYMHDGRWGSRWRAPTTYSLNSKKERKKEFKQNNSLTQQTGSTQVRTQPSPRRDAPSPLAFAKSCKGGDVSVLDPALAWDPTLSIRFPRIPNDLPEACILIPYKIFFAPRIQTVGQQPTRRTRTRLYAFTSDPRA